MHLQINKYITITKLLFRANAWLLKLSIWALPVSLTLSIATILFVDNLLVSYENYLKTCYVGYQGRLSVEGDQGLLDEISRESAKRGWKYSPRFDLSTSINMFYKDGTITRNLKIIVLNDDYLLSKFNDLPGWTSDGFIFNKVFMKGLGEIPIDSIKEFQVLDMEPVYKIRKIFVVDTGFLSDEPLLFLSRSFASNLFDLQGNGISKVEFMESSEGAVRSIKKTVKGLAKDFKAQRVKIYDLLYDSRESSLLFTRIQNIEGVIIGFVFFLVASIISLSMSIIISFKKKSLNILRLLGITTTDLTMTTALVILSVFVVSLFVGASIMRFLRFIFLANSLMMRDFFVHVDGLRWMILGCAGFLLIISSIITTKKCFKSLL